MLAANVEALLRGVRTREIGLRKRRFLIQHNPARVVSTAAPVDSASIAARPCFLCAANRPPEQGAIHLNGYDILANPFPIFPGHLTIASQTHQPQLIAGCVSDMLDLSEKLGMVVFYNGPQCGASAPDHLHFQAAEPEFFPLLDSLRYAEPIDKKGNISLFDLDPALFLISGTHDEIVAGFCRLMASLPLSSGQPEARVNLLALHDMLIIIPRSLHRPACYGGGSGQMLISPGTIDMAGVVVVPRPADFEAISRAQLQSIIDEVSYPADELREIFNSL